MYLVSQVLHLKLGLILPGKPVQQYDDEHGQHDVHAEHDDDDEINHAAVTICARKRRCEGKHTPPPMLRPTSSTQQAVELPVRLAAFPRTLHDQRPIVCRHHLHHHQNGLHETTQAGWGTECVK